MGSEVRRPDTARLLVGGPAISVGRGRDVEDDGDEEEVRGGGGER